MPGLAQRGLRIWCCHQLTSCSVGRGYGLALVLLWLWRRLAAAALIPPLAQEFPYGFWGFFVLFVFSGPHLQHVGIREFLSWLSG